MVSGALTVVSLEQYRKQSFQIDFTLGRNADFKLYRLINRDGKIWESIGKVIASKLVQLWKAQTLTLSQAGKLAEGSAEHPAKA